MRPRMSTNTGRAPVRWSRHNMSYRLLQDAEFGILYPVMRKHVVPGDRIRVGNEIVLRMMPTVAPILHEVNVFVHYFFCPYRILWDGWENFITGGQDGNDSSTQPVWQGNQSPGSLCDYMHFDTDSVYNGLDSGDPKLLAYPQIAYNMIWNEYYRDQYLQDVSEIDNNGLLNRSWEKDYFTSALYDTQLGDAPAVPLEGTFDIINNSGGFVSPIMAGGTPGTSSAAYVLTGTPTGWNPGITFTLGPPGPNTPLTTDLTQMKADATTGVTFDVNDMRFIFQLQKWKERNMRAGVRYTEFIKAHFPASPRDDRLQRPEYFGGSRSPIIISEVVQTSADQAAGTPSGNPSFQGNLAGHGITADRTIVGSYRVQEYGLIMGLMSIMPRPLYIQGNDREFTIDNRYDYFFPEFQHIGEQPVYGRELLSVPTATTSGGVDNYRDYIFGYQGRYNELRHSKDRAVGTMRNDLAYWHLGRAFDATAGNQPKLNSEFIVCDPPLDPFAVPSVSPFVVNVGNIIHMTRPMVGVPNPGLIDHF